MTCESVEDDCTAACCEDIDTDAQMFMPCILEVTSLSTNDGSSEHSSENICDFMSAEREPLSVPVSQSQSKCGTTDMDCRVILERLPDALVQSAETCKIFVSNDSGAVFLEGNTELTQAFRKDDQTVKNEPGELDTAENEQATLPHPTNQHHSVTVNPTVSMSSASQLFNNPRAFQAHHDQSPINNTAVYRMAPASAATSTSSHAQSAGMMSNVVETDISVILLNCAQLPTSSASATANTSVTGPQDVSQLVLSMLQKQNINPVSNTPLSVVPVANGQQRKTGSVLSDATGNEAKLRQMLQTSEKAKTSLALKLNAEQAKVTCLRAELSSLKNTVKQLSNNRAVVKYASAGSSSAYCTNDTPMMHSLLHN